MKIQHRITGTILALAFGFSTTIAPAVTIPQMKSPPKVPMVKGAVAPKVPIAPKIVKVPTVKAPAAPKIPIAPKIVKTPQAPKVPTVKAPAAPKVPGAPKIVKVPVTPQIPVARKVGTPKTPSIPRLAVTPKVVDVARAAKIPSIPKVSSIAVKRPVVIAKPTEAPKVQAMGGIGKGKQPASATLATNRKIKVTAAAALMPSKASGIRTAVQDAHQDNPHDKLAHTFLPDIPQTPKGRNPVSGTPSSGTVPGTGESSVSKNLFDVLTGKGGSLGTGALASALPDRSVPVIRDVTGAPKFDQGFGAPPDVSGFNPDSLNPMSGIINNSGIGGPLGDAANQAGNGVPSGGYAGMGTSLISVNPLQGEISVLGTISGAATAVGVGQTIGTTAITGIGSLGATAVGGLAGAAVAGLGIGTALNAGNDAIVGGVASLLGSDIKDQVDLAIAVKDTLGGLVDSATEAVSGKTKSNEVIDIGEIVITGTPPVDNSKKTEVIDIGEIIITGNAPSAGQPDPENEGTVAVDIYALNPGIAQQIGQSRLGKKGSQGGSGDATPVDDSGNGGPVVGIEMSQTVVVGMKNNLIGNPGQRGGMREGGGNAQPPATSNGSGVITPTNDQNGPSGGREIGPENFFGNEVGPDQGRLNGSSENKSSSSSSGQDNSSDDQNTDTSTNNSDDQ